MVRVRRNNDVVVSPGEMLELNGQKSNEKYSSEYMENFYKGMIGLFIKKGKNVNRAFHLYREKFGKNPPWKKEPIEPSDEVIKYVQSRNIAYAKRRAA